MRDLTRPRSRKSCWRLAGGQGRSEAKYSQVPLAGKSVVTLFEKPSLRTRVTFDIGIAKLGGHASIWISRTGRSASGSR